MNLINATLLLAHFLITSNISCVVCAYVYVFYDFLFFIIVFRGALSSLYVNMCACHVYFNKLTYLLTTSRSGHQSGPVCLKIEIHEIHEIHKIYEIHMPKYRNLPTMYEIHCLKIEIHKVHEIHSKATLAKYQNPRNTQTVRNPHWQGSQQTNKQLL